MPKAYGSADDLLADRNVDAVVIVSPDPHAPRDVDRRGAGEKTDVLRKTAGA